MLADITIHYRAKPEPRSAIKRRFSEKTPIDFREVTADEAPLAVEWESGKTRWFEGSHFRYENHVFDEGMRMDDKLNALVRFIEGEGAREHTPTNSYVDARSNSEDRKFSPKRYPDVVETSDRLEALHKAQALAADSILVDGHLWLRCAVPRLIYFPASNLMSAHVIIDTDAYTTDPLRRGKYVRRPNLFIAANSADLDDMDSILDIASYYALPPSLPKFTLHLPDSINRTSDEEMLLAAATALNEANRNTIGSHWAKAAKESLETLSSYLRDPTGDSEVLAEILQQAATDLSGSDRDIAEHLRRVLKRWEDRPIGEYLGATGHSPTPRF